MTEFAGKVALVTGGGSGIGRGLVLAAAAEGASVVVADIMVENAEAVAAEVVAAGGSAVAVACDVSDRAAVARMKAEANEAFGRVSLLFANAGVTWFDRLTNMSDKDVDWILEVNLMGTMYCMQAFLPDMIEAREGHVIATASNAGLLSGWVPYHVPYSAAKAGIIAMMFNLRIELAEVGVGSTVYSPGGVRGKMMENNLRSRPDRFGGAGVEGGDRPDFAAFEMDWSTQNLVVSFEPEEVGPMVIEAVKQNVPIVVDHANAKPHFFETYVDPIVAAFDAAGEWQQTLPRLQESGQS